MDIKNIAEELPLLLLYDGNDPDYVQRKLEQASQLIIDLQTESNKWQEAYKISQYPAG